MFSRVCVFFTLALFFWPAAAVPPASPRSSAPLRLGKAPDAPNTALVLAGGGAKGAYQIGLLAGMCVSGGPSSQYGGTWSLIVGTSIGALNGGLLAQYDKSQQCLSTGAVPAAKAFWDSISSPDDIYVSSAGLGTCVSLLNAAPAGVAFYRSGGLCDPAPGRALYAAHLDVGRLRASTVDFAAPASSLNAGRAVWFDKQAADLADGILASAAISPLVYPEVIGGATYIDGGVYHPVPVLGALSRGAQRVLVVLLEPIGSGGGVPVNSSFTGSSILSLFYNEVPTHVALQFELEGACRQYPDAEILAWAPNSSLGGFTDFYAPQISQMYQRGWDDATARAPVDLCAALSLPRGEYGRRGYSAGFVAGVGVGCWLAGMAAAAVAILALAYRRRRARAAPAGGLLAQLNGGVPQTDV